MRFGLTKIVSGIFGRASSAPAATRAEPTLEKMGAGQLPPIVEPKVPTKPQAQQSFSKRSRTSNGDQRLTATDRRTANLDLLTLRNGTSTKSTIHDLAQVSPDLSASVWAYQRMVVTRDFTAVARNEDGTPNPEATPPPALCGPPCSEIGVRLRQHCLGEQLLKPGKGRAKGR